MRPERRLSGRNGSGRLSRPASLAAILAQSDKSQGFGDSVPKLNNAVSIFQDLCTPYRLAMRQRRTAVTSQ